MSIVQESLKPSGRFSFAQYAAGALILGAVVCSTIVLTSSLDDRSTLNPNSDVLASPRPVQWEGIQFDSAIWDFGTVDLFQREFANSTKLTHSFRLSNVAGEKVTVKSVRSSCGCISTEQGPFVLAPGGQKSLEVAVL
jgi:hypothetical protein